MLIYMLVAECRILNAESVLRVGNSLRRPMTSREDPVDVSPPMPRRMSEWGEGYGPPL